MKTTLLLSSIALVAGPLLAADSLKDEITSAANKLADSPNYGWKQTVVVPEASRFRPGPTEGRTEKEGLTHVTMTFGDNTTHAVLKGDKAAFTGREGEWQSVSDVESNEGRGRFMGRFVRSIRTPAAHVLEMLENIQDVKKDGDAYTATLTPKSVEDMLTFRGRGGDNGPTVTGAKGSIKVWVKDGVLSKYEYKVQGKVSWNDNEWDGDRTTTVDIKDIGTTKLDVPAEATRKLT